MLFWFYLLKHKFIQTNNNINKTDADHITLQNLFN